MYKLALKITAPLLLMVVGFLFLSGGHASALNWNCPGAPYGDWGNRQNAGANQNQMASLTVQAQDASGSPLNVHYTIHSVWSGGSANNNQIYKYSGLSHSYDPNNSTDHVQFMTGENLSGDGGTQCNGFDEIGPGVSGQIGNGYVLNCDDGNGHHVYYWLSNIDNPGGADGKWELWKGGVQLSSDVNTDAAAWARWSPGSGQIPPYQLTVTNGSDTQIKLIWKPTYHAPTGSVNAAVCQLKIHVRGVTNGFSSNPQYYVHITSANGSNTTNVWNQSDFNVPGWVKNITGSHNDVSVRLHVIDVNGHKIPTGNTAIIDEPWSNCGGHNADEPECSSLSVTDGGSATINSKSFDSSDVRTLVRVVDSSNHVLVHNPNGANDFVIVNDETKSWSGSDYVVRGVQVTDYVYRQYYHNTGTKDSNGNWIYAWDNIPAGSKDGSGNDLTGDQTRTHTCYATSCSIRVTPDATIENKGVKAGSTMAVNINITNLAGTWALPNGLVLPSSLAGSGFTFNSDPGQTPGLTGISAGLPEIGKGETYNQTIYMTAPSRVGQYTFSATPGYSNLFFTQSSGCSTTFSVYGYFELDPSAGFSSVAGDYSENPNPLGYFSKADKGDTWPTLSSGDPAKVQASVITYLTKNGSTVPGTPKLAPNGIYGSNQYNYGYAQPESDIHAGDRYCTSMNISAVNGWVGPGGPSDLAKPTSYTTPANCFTVINEPYVRAYGGDVNAGGGFEGVTTDTSRSCKTPSGGIYAYSNSSSTNKAGGSAVQFGALANNQISGFASGSLLSPTATPTQLSFANTATSGGPPIANLGGSLNTRHCIPDYFADKPDDTTASSVPTSPVNISTAPNATTNQYYKQTSASPATLTISGGAIAKGSKTAIYVEGANVHIAGDIAYAGGWSSLSDIPSLYIVAKPNSAGQGGNIYIDPSVKQLDGIYVAQPIATTDTPATIAGGTIDTCASANGSYNRVGIIPSGIFFSTCKNQLLVNGAFVAQQVKLNRTFGSLRNGRQIGETMTNNGTACSNAGTRSPGIASCAAEIFNFGPAAYITEPSFTSSSGPASGTYDYITSLPPVF